MPDRIPTTAASGPVAPHRPASAASPDGPRRRTPGYLSLVRHLLLAAIASSLCPPRLRMRLLRLAGVRVGRPCDVYPGFQLTGRGRVTLGDLSFVNRDALFDNAAAITLGAGVLVGHRATFVTSTHPLTDDPGRRGGDRYDAPIVIGDGCWIGAGVTVLPGVTVGAGSVVAAGAVVAGDLPPNGMYGGVPATLIRELAA
jgi:maltose O-acetyltransferase